MVLGGCTEKGMNVTNSRVATERVTKRALVVCPVTLVDHTVNDDGLELVNAAD
jgi:hypothetical protein